MKCDDCGSWRRLPADAFVPEKWNCSDNDRDLTRFILTLLAILHDFFTIFKRRCSFSVSVCIHALKLHLVMCAVVFVVFLYYLNRLLICIQNALDRAYCNAPQEPIHHDSDQLQRFGLDVGKYPSQQNHGLLYVCL